MEAGAQVEVRRKGLRLVVGIVASIALCWVVFEGLDLSVAVRILSKVSWPPLVIAFACHVVGLLCVAWRTQSLMESFSKIKFDLALRATLALQVGNLLLPVRAGELLRFELLRRESQAVGTTLAGATILERGLDLFSVLLMLVVCFFLGIWRPAGITSVWLLAGVIVISVPCFLLRKPLLQFLLERADSQAFRQVNNFVRGVLVIGGKRSVSKVVSLTAVRWLSSACAFELWLHSFSLNLPWYSPLLLIGLTSLSAAVPSSPGFVGTYHYAVSVALGVLGVGEDMASTFALLTHILFVVPVSLVGLITLVILQRRLSSEQ